MLLKDYVLQQESQGINTIDYITNKNFIHLNNFKAVRPMQS